MKRSVSRKYDMTPNRADSGVVPYLKHADRAQHRIARTDQNPISVGTKTRTSHAAVWGGIALRNAREMAQQ